jgi:hypothetical protein
MRKWVLNAAVSIFKQAKIEDGEMDGYNQPFIRDLKGVDVMKDIKKKCGVLRVVKRQWMACSQKW